MAIFTRPCASNSFQKSKFEDRDVGREQGDQRAGVFGRNQCTYHFTYFKVLHLSGLHAYIEHNTQIRQRYHAMNVHTSTGNVAVGKSQ